MHEVKENNLITAKSNEWKHTQKYTHTHTHTQTPLPLSAAPKIKTNKKNQTRINDLLSLISLNINRHNSSIKKRDLQNGRKIGIHPSSENKKHP